MSHDAAVDEAVHFLCLWWSQGPRSGNPDDFVSRAQHYIDTYTALGLLHDGQAARWTRRFRVAAIDKGQTIPDPPIDVAGYLDQTFDAVEGEIAVGSETHVRLNATLNAIAALNAVPEIVIHNEWVQKLGQRITVPRQSAEPPAHVQEGMRATRRWQGVTGGALRRVIPGRDERRLGLRVMSVELYDDVVAVQWHYVGGEASWPNTSFGRPVVELADDLGTRYEGRAGGGGRMDNQTTGPAVVRGVDTFLPAVPAAAKLLRVLYEDEAIEIELR